MEINVILGALFGIGIGYTIAHYRMIVLLNRKERRICNLRAMCRNRDNLIDTQRAEIKTYRSVINSLEDDNISLKESAFELAKPKRKTKKN